MTAHHCLTYADPHQRQRPYADVPWPTPMASLLRLWQMIRLQYTNFRDCVLRLLPFTTTFGYDLSVINADATEDEAAYKPTITR